MKTLFRYKSFSITYLERNWALPFNAMWGVWNKWEEFYFEIRSFCIAFTWQSHW